MPRNISMALTTDAIRDRTKTVTRRTGWRFAKVGDLLWSVEKSQGLKKGERVFRLALIEVESVRQERLDALIHPGRYRKPANYPWKEMAAEGLPDLSPGEFVERWVSRNGGTAMDEVTRIGFDYIPAWVPCPGGDGEFVCNIHGGHAAECPCPEAEDPFWGNVDPYE